MKIKQTVLVIALLIGLGAPFAGSVAHAAECGGVKTSILTCSQNDLGSCSDGSYPENGGCTAGKCSDRTKPVRGVCTNPRAKYTPAKAGATYKPPDIQNNGIWGLLLIAINILTAGIGVAAVAGIVWGSILYTTASGKPEQVKKANVVIANTVLGIIMYALLFAFLNYIIPGGLFAS